MEKHKGKSLLGKQKFNISWIILDIVENNNPLRWNDMHSEINYDSKWYDLFSKRLLGGNELDTWFIFLLVFFIFLSFSHQIIYWFFWPCIYFYCFHFGLSHSFWVNRWNVEMRVYACKCLPYVRVLTVLLSLSYKEP